MTKLRIVKIIYVMCLIGFIAFIFSNSITPKTESAEQSGKVLGIVNTILETLNIPLLKSDLLIRKLGHFAEYFILGASFFGLFVINKQTKMIHTLYASYLSCLTAITDETIQYFSERGSMLLDVWLDYFSAIIAILLFKLIISSVYIKSKIKDV